MNIKKHKISILIFTMLSLGWASTVYYYEKIRDYPVKNTQDYPVKNTI